LALFRKKKGLAELRHFSFRFRRALVGHATFQTGAVLAMRIEQGETRMRRGLSGFGFYFGYLGFLCPRYHQQFLLVLWAHLGHLALLKIPQLSPEDNYCIQVDALFNAGAKVVVTHFIERDLGGDFNVGDLA
jgi:hypothetical protein